MQLFNSLVEIPALLNVFGESVWRDVGLEGTVADAKD